jgi:hypothetical protein
MKVYPKSIREGRGKYCSRKCYYEAIKPKLYEHICSECGKKVFLQSWRHYTGKRNYFCGTPCYRDYRKNHPEYKQPLAYKRQDKHPFLTPDLLTEEYVKNGLKMEEIAKKYKYGYTTVNWWIRKYKIKTRIMGDYMPKISFNAVSVFILKKRGNKCELCGWDKARCDVHHKIPRSESGSNKEENLIILCPNCHRMVTEKKLKI